MLKNAIDMHVHSAPDIIPRKFDDLELARHYSDNGFSAVVLKNHFGDTAARAKLASNFAEETEIFGGIALNHSAGGLNPAAVEVSVKLGGKVVWMPTVDSRNHKKKLGEAGGISILDEGGKLKSEVLDILDIVKSADIVLATGHLSSEETVRLVDEARALGVKKIVVTHPEFWITRLPLDLQISLARFDVFFERCYYSSTLKDEHHVPFSTVVEEIKTVGIESTIISSDLGQKENISPAEGFERMIEELLTAGFQEKEIERMIVENPASVLY